MLDHITLRDLVFSLAALLRRDLESHHPGHLPAPSRPKVAAWKQRILTKPAGSPGPRGPRRPTPSAADGAPAGPSERVQRARPGPRHFGAGRDTDGDLSDSVYYGVWASARASALTAEEAASPLARWRCDFRLAAASRGSTPASHRVALTLALGRHSRPRTGTRICHSHPETAGRSRARPDRRKRPPSSVSAGQGPFTRGCGR